MDIDIRGWKSHSACLGATSTTQPQRSLLAEVPYVTGLPQDNEPSAEALHSGTHSGARQSYVNTPRTTDQASSEHDIHLRRGKL